jgi:hypothetical protein
MEDNITPFRKLNSIDVQDLTKKKNGKTYLGWSHAWEQVKKQYENVSFEIKEFNGLPYTFDPNTGYMVFTSVTIEGQTHPMWLPVTNGANKAMKAERYFYEVEEWENGKKTGNLIKKWVEPATMFDINKAIMRCLVKNLALFGLGLYIYRGEIGAADIVVEPTDIAGLSIKQIFKKYDISVNKANKYLVEASGPPFDSEICFDKMTEEQTAYLQRTAVIQWLVNVACQ